MGKKGKKKKGKAEPDPFPVEPEPEPAPVETPAADAGGDDDWGAFATVGKKGKKKKGKAEPEPVPDPPKEPEPAMDTIDLGASANADAIDDWGAFATVGKKKKVWDLRLRAICTGADFDAEEEGRARYATRTPACASRSRARSCGRRRRLDVLRQEKGQEEKRQGT